MNLTAATRIKNQARPPLWHEAFAGLELLSLRWSPVFTGVGVPQGDGSPVIVVPGLFASDQRLSQLHDWIARIGYKAYYSNIGRNIELPERTMPRLVATVEQAYRETGRRAIIVGHSLGGLLARGVATQCPDKVALVVTLGSPVRGMSVHPLIVAIAELLGGRSSKDGLVNLQQPLPNTVSEVNVYSKDDGVVDWRSCTTPGAASVRVHGTHRGMVVSRQVYESLATVLAERAAAELARESTARAASRARRSSVMHVLSNHLAPRPHDHELVAA